MNQEQALEEFKKLRPEAAHMLKVERSRSIGYDHGSMNQFYLWDYANVGGSALIASSERSFEHALAIAKSGDEDCWPEDDSPVEDEVTA